MGVCESANNKNLANNKSLKHNFSKQSTSSETYKKENNFFSQNTKH